VRWRVHGKRLLASAPSATIGAAWLRPSGHSGSDGGRRPIRG